MFLLPWFIGIFVLTIGPMIQSFYYSLTKFDVISPPQYIGLDNYKTMFTSDARFLTSLKVTIIYVFTSVPFKLAFALFVAALMNRGLRGLGFYRTLYYLPTLLGGSVAIAVLWRKMFGGSGALNRFLLLLGIEAPDWVANPKYALYSIVALSVWQFGSSMIIFLAGLKQIPQDFYEAAQVDGAGKIKQFFHITLPLLTPVIFFNLVIQLIGSFQAFTQSFIISGGQGGPMDSTLFYTLYLYMKGFTFYEMGYASAMAWVLLVIIGLFTALIFGSSKFWVHYGDGGDRMALQRQGSKLLLHIVILGLGLFMLYPILWLVSSSFKPSYLIFTDLSLWPKEVTLDNYIKGWAGIARVRFSTFFVNSFIVSALCVAGNLVSCSMAAYAFGRLDFSWKKMWFSLMLVTIMLAASCHDYSAVHLV
ncbi:ABC transporter permease subunit [Paenibacillus sp. P25]|nr:ABC transporter permease subunit [Paenibacillus sp. P25]